jgi:hypothetical protein
METIVRMLILSLIGNPVKIGDGPAAVTSPFSMFICNKTSGERNPFGLGAPLFLSEWEGR